MQYKEYQKETATIPQSKEQYFSVSQSDTPVVFRDDHDTVQIVSDTTVDVGQMQ